MFPLEFSPLRFPEWEREDAGRRTPNFQIASAFSPKTAVATVNDLPFRVLIENAT
jgi:hypothetical protein